MADVAQLVRASGCGSEGRGFETHHSPQICKLQKTILWSFVFDFSLLFSAINKNCLMIEAGDGQVGPYYIRVVAHGVGPL